MGANRNYEFHKGNAPKSPLRTIVSQRTWHQFRAAWMNALIALRSAMGNPQLGRALARNWRKLKLFATLQEFMPKTWVNHFCSSHWVGKLNFPQAETNHFTEIVLQIYCMSNPAHLSVGPLSLPLQLHGKLAFDNQPKANKHKLTKCTVKIIISFHCFLNIIFIYNVALYFDLIKHTLRILFKSCFWK